MTRACIGASRPIVLTPEQVEINALKGTVGKLRKEVEWLEVALDETGEALLDAYDTTYLRSSQLLCMTAVFVTYVLTTVL